MTRCVVVCLVTASIVIAWLLLLPAAGLCQRRRLLWAADSTQPWSWRLSTVLRPVSVQSKSLRWGHESVQSDRCLCL